MRCKSYVASPNYFKNRTLVFFVNKKIPLQYLNWPRSPYLAPLNSNRPSPGNMSERGKGTRKRFPRRAASSASTTSTSAAASSSNSSPFSTAAPLAKRAKTVEELAAAAANKKQGNWPKRAFAELSQAAGLAAPTLQAVVDQAARKARMKNGQRTSARADGDDQQRSYFRRGEQEVNSDVWALAGAKALCLKSKVKLPCLYLKRTRTVRPSPA